ncbi:ABC transporter permease [Paeniglutamicibacter sulfureus]|uniref:Fructose transport system permease protein n=1 Tax=Paeniglutamicibacter sulfureus TaxID=43666 RepID=A0ABU2BFM7_9MICC|nr:ABC transporter permease [Paeniglutamicibacter sulfureus]MDR7357442.1 fructose transport system permease protein [Paeniglutamicibacter sulfureus]
MSSPLTDSVPASPIRGARLLEIIRQPLLGPLAALVIAVIVFSFISDNFLSTANLSLLLQQSVVIGILAVGQTLIILTGGIDLSIGAVAILGTLVMAKIGAIHGPWVGLAAAAGVCILAGLLNGALVAVLGLPPFIVTLGTFTVFFAATQLYAGSQTYAAIDGLQTFLGDSFKIGTFTVTYGILAMFVVYLLVWYMLKQTATGQHIYAVGGNPGAAQLVGIKTKKTLLYVYGIAGLIAAVAAWAAMGRIPVADPNAFQQANLETITAVVIGGTSLFGGRGSVFGTLFGMLIVSVLRSGLTAAGVDALYQNIATGVLVIAAVALDTLARRRSS